MEISFDTIALRTLCEDPAVADAAYNLSVAASLRSRLADLAAATSVYDLPVGTPRPFNPDEPTRYVLDLFPPYTLHFCSAHVKPPHLPTGEVDWHKVNRIKLLAITRKS
ncbi:hypothetical protein GCM10028822_41250 [Hymenobacter terrigena]